METSATANQPRAAAQPRAEAWHTRGVQDVLRSLDTDQARGLASSEVDRRLEEHGPNELEQSEGRSALAILLAQFKSLIVALLVAATAIAFVMGESLEGIAILVVILLNAAVGFFTEWKAQAALSALRRQAVPTAHVLRDGEEHEIEAAELVPGDIVLVDAGSRIPADGRVIESAQLQVAEASLTGESHAVAKGGEPVDDPSAPLGDRTSMLYMGTAVTDGRGKFVVTATGSRTEVGHIGTMIEQAGTRETPLERKLAQLGNSLVGVVLVLCAVIVGIGWLRGNELLRMVEVGISLAIAAVPEGLPAVTTMTLALGMQRMAKMRALIRRLPAVETLGSTTVICTDKTGTLTRNEMTLQRFNLAGRVIEITGTGYSSEGEFREGEQKIDPATDEHLALALRIGALCSDATIERTGEETKVLGDPTEGALVVAAEKAGLPKAELERDYPRIGEIPFSSQSQRMTTVHRTPDGKVVAFLKGGPAVVVEASSHQLTADGTHPLDDQRREAALEHGREMAAQALRVLAIASKELPREEYDEAELETGYTLVGMLGMIDPLREEAREAIATCREAGIRTVMITGDQALTAQEIGRQLGLDRDAEGHERRTAHGRDLADLKPEEWHKFASEVAVFARVSPEHKLRIVEALQSGGDVVAMTGDGVNDAPALKQADIGIAMGIKGTEVAKEASAMVITDDNFATIVGAVEQGRVIYSNIRRFVHFLFSCNLAEILTVFVSLLIGWPLPLGALQILWLNMITDVFPALSLALEPAAPDVMRQPPRDPREPLVNRRFVWLISWQGLLLTAATLAAFAIGRQWYGDDTEGHAHSTTIAFMTLAIAQVFHVFNARSQRDSAFSSRMFSNPWLWGAILFCLLLQYAAVSVPLLQSVLDTVPLTLRDWSLVAGCSVAPVVVVEVVKLTSRLLKPRTKG